MRIVSSIAVAFILCSSLASGQQRAAIDVALGAARLDSESWTRQAMLSPSFDLRGSSWFAKFDADVATAERQARLQHAGVSIASRLSSVGPVAFSLALRGNRAAFAGSGTQYDAAADLGASARFGSAGGYVTGGARSGGMKDVKAGAWKSWRGSVVTVARTYSFMPLSLPVSSGTEVVSVTSLAVDTVVPNPGPVSENSERSTRFEDWTETEARMNMAAGRFLISASIASRGRGGHPDSTFAVSWGHVNVATRIDSRFSLIAGAGSVPISAQPGSRTTRFLSLGLRVAPRTFSREPLPVVVRPSSTTFDIHKDTDGAFRLRLRVPGARTVSLSGDFTGWKPVKLREVSPGLWETTVPIDPGVHHVSISVNDEEWTAPSGLPSVEDEFNGGARVGVIVVL